MMKKPAKAKSVIPAISMDRKYHVEDAIHHLTKAAEIKKDPKLMAEVRQHAAAKIKTLHSIKGRKS